MGRNSVIPSTIARIMVWIYVTESLYILDWIIGVIKTLVKYKVPIDLKDSYCALRYNLANKEVRIADVVIEPEMRYIDDFDFIGGKDAIIAGEKAAEKKMKEIKRLF